MGPCTLLGTGAFAVEFACRHRLMMLDRRLVYNEFPLVYCGGQLCVFLQHHASLPLQAVIRFHGDLRLVECHTTGFTLFLLKHYCLLFLRRVQIAYAKRNIIAVGDSTTHGRIYVHLLLLLLLVSDAGTCKLVIPSIAEG